MQISPGRTTHLKTFKAMQKNSEPLKHVNSCILIGALPVEKRLLIIGISSAQRPPRISLLDTLQSLFLASSSSEQKYFTVLVHLADPDPKELDQMRSTILTLFKSHVQARRLVLITTPLHSYHPLKHLKKTSKNTPAQVAFHSKQNMDYAFLMKFATNHSEYFLTMEDDVTCEPGFVTHIVTTLASWAQRFWITLQFSQLNFTGKLFHTSDLPYFVHFLLLFYQEMPCHDLLSHFHEVLQQKPIEFSPSLFQRMSNYSSFEGIFSSFKKKGNDIGSPSNPAATIYTNLNVTNSSALMNAYSLDKSFFSIEDAEVGSHLTLILDKPSRVFRVQVLTGSELEEENQVKEGQVELGYDTTNRINDCDDYVLLGLLVNGTLNKQVLSEKSGKKVKCVRLVVTGTLASGFIVRHINLWTK
ncbi:alpha-1,3-mannosyl-glycoprotein 4-beta-N-acetylglucosaminyltransferase C-like isoform X2 [Ochotona princeps]|nr:alpha-1,3-mannosyl-glycoprotein 4-beta-N-acetylglucosaminyltransferase C-like isoform X2 [Ochotona princeps]